MLLIVKCVSLLWFMKGTFYGGELNKLNLKNEEACASELWALYIYFFTIFTKTILNKI